MPIYEYVCEDCKARYERLVMSSTQEITCPQCAGPRHTLVFSTFSAQSANDGSSTSSASATSCACTPSTCGCH